MMSRLRAALAGLIVLTTLPTAEAGSGAEPITPFAIEDSADFAKQIERDLAAQGTRLALVFRSGRPREDLPDGIAYTHGAFWIYAEAQTVDGETHRGYAVHNLYHFAEDRRQSYLAQDWPINFVQGDVVGEVGVIIPTPELQRRILMLFASGAYRELHHPDYSLISHPHDLRYQNCNEYMLDVIAAAIWETTDRERLKRNLDAHFEPARLRTSLLERMFGPSVDDRIRLEDHSGTIRTTTFSAIADFMIENGFADAAYEIQADHVEAQES
ncbi:MAG: DUF2145 domain-containing protein [Alphaproteobacteria bacterium]|nr:DUF2145 domain-containing protein [Alphaproteobacteria bacterium]